MVAGVAAGIAAVFRTPLGAALLAVEVLYRDDFESDALIPAVLASVVAYSVVISIFGESTLFAHAAALPVRPGAPAALRAAGAAGLGRSPRCFLRTLARRAEAVGAAHHPAVGASRRSAGWRSASSACRSSASSAGASAQPGQGLGLLGGGYGAVQVAITGAPLAAARAGRGAELLLLLCAGQDHARRR